MLGLYLEGKVRPCYVVLRKNGPKVKALFHGLTANVNGSADMAIVELVTGELKKCSVETVTLADSKQIFNTTFWPDDKRPQTTTNNETEA